MNSVIDYDEETVKIQPKNGVIMVDHKHLIKSAIDKEIPWNTLACFLTDFVLSPDKLKDIIKTLVQELERLVSKIDNRSDREKIEVFEQSYVIEEKRQCSNDSEGNDFVESYEMYLVNETSETQAMELPQNFEDKIVHYNHESYSLETSNQVTNLEKSKSFTSNKEKNIKQPGNKNFECDVCYKSFKTKPKLQAHQKTHSGEKPYNCKFCPKKFSHSFNLKVHERIHKDKRFKCDICHKCFKTEFALQTHQQRHKGDKPFECKICSKTYFLSHHLKEHERHHSGEKPFKCSMCNKGFIHSSDLTKHTRTHTGERPYQCKLCKKYFSCNSNLNEHKRTHTGEKPYQCTFCEKSFSQLSNLKRHENKTHFH